MSSMDGWFCSLDLGQDVAKPLLCSGRLYTLRTLLRARFRFGSKRSLPLVFVGACMLLSGVGMLAFGGVVGYIGMGLCLALVVVEITMSVSAQTGLDKRLENAQPCECMFTGAASGATTGLWRGVRVQVGSSGDGL